ncbi:MAG: beta-ketoacyl synthase [Tannerella sp.]|jgi:3-oxoacyl-[acyl-carrier-protein] synthase-1|nr:beta-ketoacyl synthase [Tannerella sp.]
MTTIIGDNVISALGFSSEENYDNVKAGKTGLRLFSDKYDIPEPFVASEIDDERLETAFNQLNIEKSHLYTKFEKATIVSANEAIKRANINPADDKVLFVLSTTKGNVFLLGENEGKVFDSKQVYLWRSAQLIAEFFGNRNEPLVVSNACISGASAIIAGKRILQSKQFDYVIVIGVDVLSKFIVTGFQSFKALSQDVCKPFDAHRTGLNIGEAAATVILTENPDNKINSRDIVCTAGAVRNDANHISGPSRTGEGSYLALQKILENVNVEELAFINAHGTATPYNDEMESVSLTRAGLQNVPVNSLKGYFGHTLGAAGVLESVISTQALKDGTVLKTYGFDTLGVTNLLNIAKNNLKTNKKQCIKLLSGFGGCNSAVLYTLF